MHYSLVHWVNITIFPQCNDHLCAIEEDYYDENSTITTKKERVIISESKSSNTNQTYIKVEPKEPIQCPKQIIRALYGISMESVKHI